MYPELPKEQPIQSGNALNAYDYKCVVHSRYALVSLFGCEGHQFHHADSNTLNYSEVQNFSYRLVYMMRMYLTCTLPHT